MDTKRKQAVIITGAGSGIGRATAGLLASEYFIYAADLDKSRASSIVEQLPDHSATAVCVDVRDERSVKDAYRAIAADANARAIQISGLVNCAGMSSSVAFESMDLDTWCNVLETNLTGTMLMCRDLVRSSQKTTNVSIVNVASVMAHTAAANLSPYIASKGGVVSLTRALAAELGPEGTRVNAISPGYFPTEITRRAFNNSQLGEKAAAATALGRVGGVSELPPVIAFLLSDAASYITGVTLPVDGGITAGHMSLASPLFK